MALVLLGALHVSDAVQLAVEVERDHLASREGNAVIAAEREPLVGVVPNLAPREREDRLDLLVGRCRDHRAVDVHKGEDAIRAVNVVAVEDGVRVGVVRLASDVQLVHALERLDHVRLARVQLAEERVAQVLRARHEGKLLRRLSGESMPPPVGGHVRARVLLDGPIADVLDGLQQFLLLRPVRRRQLMRRHLLPLHEDRRKRAVLRVPARIKAQGYEVERVLEQRPQPAVMLSLIRRLERELARREVRDVLRKVRRGEEDRRRERRQARRGDGRGADERVCRRGGEPQLEWGRRQDDREPRSVHPHRGRAAQVGEDQEGDGIHGGWRRDEVERDV